MLVYRGSADAICACGPAGPPRGSQAVFSRALQAVFGDDTAQPHEATLVEMDEPKTREEVFSQRLLKLLVSQGACRQKLNEKVSCSLVS